MLKKSISRYTCASALFCASAFSALADRANVGYYEDAQIEALAASDFTHIIFAFINLCSVDTSVERGFTCPGTSPVPVWNIKAVYDANGNPIPELQAAMKTLTDAGKTLYMSIGAAQNPETWDFMAGATAAERIAAATALGKFMTDYGITGVDFDYEAGSSDGFLALAEAMVALDPVPPFSMAPYSTTTMPSQFDTTSTQWQYCQFVQAGVTPTLINRQYYSGGFSSDVVAAVRGDLQPFNCSQAGGDSTTITIQPAQMSPGIGVPGASSPSNCGPSGSPTSYADCASIASDVVAAFPGIGGMSLWDIDGLEAPQTYACELGNALNGTDQTCP